MDQVSVRPTYYEALRGIGKIDWGDIINKSVDAVTSVFKGRYGVPPTGTVIYQRTPEGVTQVSRVPTISAGIMAEPVSPGIWLAGAAILGLVVLFALTRR